MKEKIKKILPVFILFLYVVFPLSIDARSGCCSWHGGVCGCQCCDGTPLSSTCLPYYPECGGGGFYNPPSYDYPSYTPSIPDCPLNSYYDSISDSCKCYSGYVASGGKCISTSQWCQDKYGIWATYDYLTDGCKCMSGYVFGEDFLGKTTCISADQYCRDKYGFNARYNILTDSCECSYGYVLSGGRCVDGDTLCHQQYGFNSYYDSLSDSCKCNYGYVFDSNNQCVSEDDYCQDLYGYYAEQDFLTDKCVCKKGYVFNDSVTKCIDGDTYCRDKYGIHASYDYWDEKCKCDTGYVVSGNKCIDGDTYCQNLYGSHLSYNSTLKQCECDYGYKFRDGKCVTPEISKIYPLEVEVGEEITIRGNNFGDSKYENLKLYVGSIKVNTLDISRWQDDKIIFEVGDYLESGYVTLKDDNTINVRSSYLEILEPEEDYISVYPFIPTEEKPITFQQPTIESEPKPESVTEEIQPESETQPKPEDEVEETQETKQQEIRNERKPEQKKSFLTSISTFVASIFNAVKNFFYRIFH